MAGTPSCRPYSKNVGLCTNPNSGNCWTNTRLARITNFRSTFSRAFSGKNIIFSCCGKALLCLSSMRSASEIALGVEKAGGDCRICKLVFLFSVLREADASPITGFDTRFARAVFAGGRDGVFLFLRMTGVLRLHSLPGWTLHDLQGGVPSWWHLIFDLLGQVSVR